MSRRPYTMFVIILVLLAVAIWVDFSQQLINPFTHVSFRDVPVQLGLDLRGGLETLLEADVPASQAVSADNLNVARQILENRANALGVSEVVMQSAPPRRIVAEFPGLQDPQQVIDALQHTGLLEFVDMGSTPVQAGTTIQTDFGTAANPVVTQTPGPTGAAVTGTSAEQLTATSIPPTAAPTSTTEPATATVETAAAGTQTTPAPTTTAAAAAPTVYHTVMTGASLSTVLVEAGTQVGSTGYVIAFTLNNNAIQPFSDYTGSHIGQYLAIVLDKNVIEAPVINAKIDKGSGYIEGNFTYDSANALAIQLRYGSLPIPLKVVESQTVGPTLGAESVRRSLFAGIIGLAAVVIFMILYYRLPGFVATLALAVYAALIMMLFKLIPVVLTLSGIAGFILSIGMAVDANILIFERLKEEVRSGRTLRQAIDLGWARAWPSIRDANISTLITCIILYWFGSAFGASVVKGFALTLFIGVLVSLFTAIIVTRTFLHIVLDNVKFAEHPRWFGITESQR